jgi:hypothetical protein
MDLQYQRNLPALAGSGSVHAFSYNGLTSAIFARSGPGSPGFSGTLDNSAQSSQYSTAEKLRAVKKRILVRL